MASSNCESSTFFKAESGVQLLARIGGRPSLQELEPELFSGLSSSSVVELSGAPNVGKTLLLTQLTAHCLLPGKWKNQNIGGLNCGVIYIDCDYHFNILKLVDLLEEIVDKSSSDIPASETENLIKRSLQKLLVYKCNDSKHLILTLHAIHELLANQTETSLVIVDSISAFYWLDKTYSAYSFKGVEKYYSNISKALRHLVETFKVTLIVSRQTLFKSQKTKNSKVEEDLYNDEEYAYLGQDWKNLVTHRVTLHFKEGYFTAEVQYSGITSNIPYTINSGGISWKCQLS